MSAQARQLVNALPRPLLNFFKKHPPASQTQWAPITGSTDKSPRNPFHPHKNTTTLKFNEPRYSVRRQTDLVKMAREYGLDHLLPPRVDHKENLHPKADTPMKGLIRWKGTKMERTRDARRAAIQMKLKAARIVVHKRTKRTKAKKQRQRII